MQFVSAKSPVWLDAEHTRIDLLATFDELGEVPYCASSTDVHQECRDLFTRAQNGEFGPIVEYAAPVPTIQQTKAALQAAVQQFMDADAKAHGYDNLLSACSYAAGPNPYQVEGEAYLTWRGAVWAYCYTVLAAVEAGTQVAPTAEALIAALPAIVRPT